MVKLSDSSVEGDQRDASDGQGSKEEAVPEKKVIFRKLLKEAASEVFAELSEPMIIDLGLDISTAVVGICALDQKTGELVDLRSLKFSPAKCPTMWDKAEAFKQELSTLNHHLKTKTTNSVGLERDCKIGRVFVEANAKMFTPGLSSADTILTLAKFNGICSYIAHNTLGVPIIDVNVVSARSRLGIKIDRKDKSKSTKEKVRASVLALYPMIPVDSHVAKTGKNKGKVVPDKEMEDRLDAFVIVAGGRILNPLC